MFSEQIVMREILAMANSKSRGPKCFQPILMKF